MDYKNIALKGGAVTVGVAVIFSLGQNNLQMNGVVDQAVHEKFT